MRTNNRVSLLFAASLSLLLMGASMHSVVMDHMSGATWFLTHSQAELIHGENQYEDSPVLAGINRYNDRDVNPLKTPAKAMTKTSLITKQLQFDILVPLHDRDKQLRAFASRLKPTLEAYIRDSAINATRITIFRLMITRYGKTEHDNAEAFRQELAQLSSIPIEHIIAIPAPLDETFQRSKACNMLMTEACHAPNCMVARIDVDMDLKPEFFYHSEQHIRPSQTAFFPIVWSEYNPQSVALVQEHFDKQQGHTQPQELEPYSKHRGHWRIWGTGMYVLSGPDAAIFRFNENFKGWGGEDGSFYDKVKAKRKIVRFQETGLIHTWHNKSCRKGIDVFTPLQIQECGTTREGEEGSELGIMLLAQWKDRQSKAK